MITLSPVELLLRVSAASVGASEHPPNTNAGPYVERVQKRTGNRKGDAWCASQVTDWGMIALGAAWPVKRTARVQEMVDWAIGRGCLLDGPPVAGDLFVIWFPSLKRYAHVGLVTAVDADGSFSTREGNTSGAGSREGWMVADRTRSLGPKDRVIRWTQALA